MVIRDAVLHLEGEQPLLGDIYRLPEPTDAGLLCTNVRTLDGHRPVFIDHTDSVFFFPFRIMRFVEIPGRSIAAGGIAPGRASAAGEVAAGQVVAGVTDLVPVPASGDEHEGDLELDEDFLRRVREV